MKKLSVFAIRVVTMNNDLIVRYGWKVGVFVYERDGSYAGPTFEPCTLKNATFYNSEIKANIEKQNRGDHFKDVTFEVTEFVQK